MFVFIVLTTLAAIFLITSAFYTHADGVIRKPVVLPMNHAAAAAQKRQAFLSRIFPFTQDLLVKIKLQDKIKNHLDAAHIKLSPAAFFNIKLLLMAAAAVLATVILGKVDALIILVCLFFAYIIPDIVLNKKIAKRKETIVKLLPETIDLLDLCVEAGLDFATAAKWVIEKVPANPMIEELSFVLEEIRWGKPRAQALKDMSRRLNIPEISSFVQTLVLAERMGTPVAEAFVILSEDARLQRFHRGERFALRAPIKILLPLIFCILPVIGIVIGGPIFLEFMSNKLF